MDSIKVGARLKRLRENTGELQSDVSNAVGVTQQAICHYEAGDRTPKDDTKIKYAKHYGVSVSEIFYNPEDQ